MYTATRTAANDCGGLIRKMRHCEEPQPFALNEDRTKNLPEARKNHLLSRTAGFSIREDALR
jgi:hypothetical protein